MNGHTMTLPRVMHWDLHAQDAVPQRRFSTELFDWAVHPAADPPSYGRFQNHEGFMLGGNGEAGEDESPGLAIFDQVDDVSTHVSEAHRLGEQLAGDRIPSMTG